MHHYIQIVVNCVFENHFDIISNSYYLNTIEIYPDTEYIYNFYYLALRYICPFENGA